MSLLSRSGAHARLRTATSLPLTSRCTTALRAPLAPQARALRTLAAPPAPRKQQQHVAAAAAPQLPELARAFDVGPGGALSVSVQSFSYKRGVPRGLDLMFDCRFLANPHWVAPLRSLDGRDPAVQAHVRADPNVIAAYLGEGDEDDPDAPLAAASDGSLAAAS